MKIVYMGTPEIAKVCLEKLYTEGFDIAAVYTKPDTPKNRGMKLIPSEVKAYAQSVGLPVIQPAKSCRSGCWISRNSAASICTQASCPLFAARARCSGRF